tara:strand:+ start:679 stop:1536 length:858 start_codon:yes stop_codon:yes gene_type:complete
MKKSILILILFVFHFSFSQAVFTENFENETVDSNIFIQWTAMDQDNDGENWEVTDMSTYASENAPQHPMTSLSADSDSWEGVAYSPNNYLITINPIDLSTISGAQIKFDVGTYQTNGTYVGDIYSIYLTTSSEINLINSTTPLTTRSVGDDCTSDQEDGSASAATLILDASSFDGQQVYLTFRHYDTVDENSVLIDNIEVGSSLGNNSITILELNYYVSNGQFIINSEEIISSIYVYDFNGKKIMSKNFNKINNPMINISNISDGIYFIRIVSENSSEKTIKISL